MSENTITIDVNALLGGQESFRQEVIGQIIDQLSEGIDRQISKKHDQIIMELINTKVANTLDRLFKEFLDIEFTPVDKWGKKAGQPKTLRDTILEEFKKETQLVSTERYNNNRTHFATIMSKYLSNEAEKFVKEYTSIIDKKVLEACHEEVIKVMKQAFKVTK